MKVLKGLIWLLALSTLYFLGRGYYTYSQSDYYLSKKSAGSGLAEGRALYKQNGCPVCHGSEGREPDAESRPRLAGQKVVYLQNQLLDIKSGKRSNGQSQLMRTMFQEIADKDLLKIARFLAAQK